MQDKVKESCMVSFRLLHSHLKLLSNNDLKRTRTEDGFKRSFATLFHQDVEIFKGTMFLNVNQLEKKLDKEEFQKIGSIAAFRVLETQFQMFMKPQISLNDEDGIMARKYFLEYTKLEVRQFRDTLIQQMESVKKSIDKRALHKRECDSRVDVNNVLSKLVTTHYLPKEREYAFAKPHHVIAPSESRNSSKNMPRFSSNDMVYNHYLEEARKRTQEKSRNLEPSVMPSARSQITTNYSKSKLRINNQRWKQMGKNFKTVGLMWVPTEKIFTISITKVDNESPHGSNTNITNLHECIQNLDTSAGTSINLQEEHTRDLNDGTPFNLKKESRRA
nr:hypothetical protein [Tanacetum cinerariifolium]